MQGGKEGVHPVGAEGGEGVGGLVVADGVQDAAGAAPLDLAAELAARPALGGTWVPVRINLAGLLLELSM